MSLVASMAWSGLAWWWGCHTQQPGLELGDLNCKLELPWGSAMEVDKRGLVPGLSHFMGSHGNQLGLSRRVADVKVLSLPFHSHPLGHFWPLCVTFCFSRVDVHLWG